MKKFTIITSFIILLFLKQVNSYINDREIKIKYSPACPIAGEEITFTVESKVEIQSNNYSWLFGDNNRNTGDTVKHTYSYQGYYMITVFGIDSSGNEYFTSIDIDIMPQIKEIKLPVLNDTIDVKWFQHYLQAPYPLLIVFYEKNQEWVFNIFKELTCKEYTTLALEINKLMDEQISEILLDSLWSFIKESKYYENYGSFNSKRIAIINFTENANNMTISGIFDKRISAIGHFSNNFNKITLNNFDKRNNEKIIEGKPLICLKENEILFDELKDVLNIKVMPEMNTVSASALKERINIKIFIDWVLENL